MDLYIKGIYSRKIFQSDNGYVIGLFKINKTNIEQFKNQVGKTITFTGYFHDLTLNDPYVFFGNEVEHPKYGKQFNVVKYERVKPEGKDGIIDFLSSDLFPGIGPVLATSIVETLGDNTLDIIINEPQSLKYVPKLSSKLADLIYKNLLQYEENHKIIVELCEMGFTMKDALNIYNVYGINTMDYLNNNIYRIIDDVNNISFLKVDKLAMQYDISETDENRIKAAIIYLIQNLTFKTGDSYVSYEFLKDQLERFLNIGIIEHIFNQYLEELEIELKIIVNNNNIYLFDLYEAENDIVEKIHYLINKTSVKHKKINNKLDKIEKKNDIKYNEMQKEAIISALNNNVSIITGGPGTGKTTIIKAIVNLYKLINNLDDYELLDELALLAPTGRAGKKMNEATNFPAMTIHRFLKWNKDLDQFSVNEYNKDKSKLIIVDEASMVDIMLFSNLLKGLTNNIKLVLVGDYDQLPSVAPGQLLKDLVESQKIKTTKLDVLYRQNEESYIPILANDIKLGHSFEIFQKYSDYQFINCSSSNIVENLKKLVISLLDNNVDLTNFQILAPMYRGINGIDNLNKQLQKVINPKCSNKTEYLYGDIIYRVNDKVIQLVNVPDENVYNGDVGIIIDIIKASLSESQKTEIYVDFEGNIIRYTSETFNQIKHAFVISIHKAQGSEFPTVIIPMCTSYRRMLYRKLIYTGITRAKEQLYVIGDCNAFVYAISNNDEYIRKSELITKIVNNL